PKSYTIRAGDCLWNIARDHLGGGQNWGEIYSMNQDIIGTNPDLIMPGTTIHLPSGAHEIAEAGKYIVQPGDNLWNISRDHLGGGQNWGEIYHANEGIIGSNPNLIQPGQELTIP